MLAVTSYSAAWDGDVIGRRSVYQVEAIKSSRKLPGFIQQENYSYKIHQFQKQ
jgi:hypothetical protein